MQKSFFKFIWTDCIVKILWQLSELDVFRASKCVKVNPDSPQKQVRLLTLEGEYCYSAIDSQTL